MVIMEVKCAFKLNPVKIKTIITMKVQQSMKLLGCLQLKIMRKLIITVNAKIPLKFMIKRR